LRCSCWSLPNNMWTELSNMFLEIESRTESRTFTFGTTAHAWSPWMSRCW
jgi:hypothetical protein